MVAGTAWVIDPGTQLARTVDPLVAHRDARWRFDVLARDGSPLGTLDRADGGSLEHSVHATIRGRGKMTVTDPDVPNWNTIRIQPWYILSTPDGEVTWPAGVFLPATPRTRYAGGRRVADVDLYDKLLVLDQDKTLNTYTAAAGTVVTDLVEQIIRDTGETGVAVTASEETLSTAMVWEPDTTWLRVINDLLGAVNYFALWCDGYGTYRADPYQAPGSRPVAYDFTQGPRAVHVPDFVHEADGFDVPNLVSLISQGDADTEPLRSEARNLDESSPWSYQGRDERWITRVETGVEATSQAVLDALAARRLSELSQVTESWEWDHAPLPLDGNDVVTFTNNTYALGFQAVVQSWSWPLTPGGLMSTRFRKVTT